MNRRRLIISVIVHEREDHKAAIHGRTFSKFSVIVRDDEDQNSAIRAIICDQEGQ